MTKTLSLPRLQKPFWLGLGGIPLFARGLLLAVIGGLLFVHCSAAGPGIEPASRSRLRILFIGNSYTFVNELPRVFAQLARSEGQAVETDMAAKGGWTLADHAKDAETRAKLGSSKWDFVVLQEQSQIPSAEPWRSQEMCPAVRSLVQEIGKTGATPILFMTWAHRDGWPEKGLPDYVSMQAQIENGYLAIARELGVQVAPAGEAWSRAMRSPLSLSLWQEDGSHPTLQGTYLAACVFYAVMFRTSPIGAAYTAGLPVDEAQRLQRTAGKTVLGDPKQWNLP